MTDHPIDDERLETPEELASGLARAAAAAADAVARQIGRPGLSFTTAVARLTRSTARSLAAGANVVIHYRGADAEAAYRALMSAHAGPWEPVPIVVPNPLMKAFVKEGLARTCGIAANLRFNYLVGLWTSLVPRDAFRVLTGDTLRSALLAVLADEALLQRVPFEPVRAYLGGDRGSLKTAQLATELARAFDDER